MAEDAPEGGHAAAGEEDEQALGVGGSGDADEDGVGFHVDDATQGDGVAYGVLVEAGAVCLEEGVCLGGGVHRE